MSDGRARSKNRTLALIVYAAGVTAVVPALVIAQIGTEFGATESFANGETLTADKLNRLVSSLRSAQAAANAAPGVGSVIAHMPNVAGALSIAAMNQRGWAECDGTSTSEVTGAVIATTPNLQGQFLRGIGGTGPASAGTAQADATAVNGLSFTHQHLTPVADSPTFCNAGFGQSNTRMAGVQVEWTQFGGNPPTSATSGCNYLTGPPTLTGANSAPVTSSDTETRPANVGVVWMMRVR